MTAIEKDKFFRELGEKTYKVFQNKTPMIPSPEWANLVEPLKIGWIKVAKYAFEEGFAAGEKEHGY